jgi:hypothetical protein
LSTHRGLPKIGSFEGADSIRLSEYHQPKKYLMRTAASGLPDFFGSRIIGCDLWDVVETILQAIHQAAVKARTCSGERIESPQSILPFLNQLRPSQISQMPGCSRLRNLQNVHEVAHAELAVAQEMKDSQTRRV